jgi:hypothetical protein
MLAGLKLQHGYLGGRILPPGNGNPWRVQGFMEHVDSDWLPAGMRHVNIPLGLLKPLGITFK